ncbi:hypothetical protein D210916BOD24_32160 [Alteromonas sp. D210916BOD_24]|uniref:hypothetical protein n=1 Tax=Alteromonas sp. D210916BOD_24 TaxID=3157618 RepID=UPI00399CA36B
MAFNPSQHPEHYVSLSVKASVLQKMLCGENLHMSDIHCTCADSKKILKQLLMQAVVSRSET